MVLIICERSTCSKSTIRDNLPEVCPSVPSYLYLFLWFQRFFFLLSSGCHSLCWNFVKRGGQQSSFKPFWFLYCFFFFRTRISQFITGSTYTVFTFSVVLWVKWKAAESLILLFIPWCRPSSEQLSKLTHTPIELFKEAEHSFSEFFIPLRRLLTSLSWGDMQPIIKLLKKNVWGKADQENCSDWSNLFCFGRIR